MPADELRLLNRMIKDSAKVEVKQNGNSAYGSVLLKEPQQPKSVVL